MAVVTGELMYRRGLSGKDKFVMYYPEFFNKYLYFNVPPSLVLRDIERAGIADIAIFDAGGNSIDYGGVEAEREVGDGEIVSVKMNPTFINEYDEWM